MQKHTRHRAPIALALSLLGLVHGACGGQSIGSSAAGAPGSNAAGLSGTCSVVPAADPSVDCKVSLTADPPRDVGLVGYACTGSARPDDNPRYLEGVPEGIVCASKGDVGGGRQGYCCSANVTSCAYNPVGSCDPGTDGFQCRGSSRPEALNAAIHCGNGVRQDQFINYCCTGQKLADGCVQVNTLGCSERLTGFSCPGLALPKGEQLGVSESRADYYRPLCPVPTVAPNVTRNNYCCYMPALVPEGASCVQDTQVPGCPAGHFGFACYGPDTPSEDYLPMTCPKPGFAGTSAEGYPATLYCCDFT
jgi:hypothetical protein